MSVITTVNDNAQTPLGRLVTTRCRPNIYISRLCYDASVHLSVTEVHWRIIANLGFKFRSHFTAHCGRTQAALFAARRPCCLPCCLRVDHLDRAMIAIARSLVTHYKDMKCNKNCKKWGGFGVPRGHWQHNHLIEHMQLPRAYSTLMKTMRVSCTVFEL